MPDPIVAADALPAGSSPAADLSPVDAADSLSALSATELHTWRETGALPSSAQVQDAAAASSPATAVAAQPASTDAPAQAASEPADTDPDYKPKTAKRIQELLQRAERAERALATATPPPARPIQPPPDARSAASSAAPAGLVKPNADSFAYGTADPEYLAALTDYTVKTTLATEREAWETAQREARATEERQRIITAFDARAAIARTAHPDFDAVAMLAPTEILPGSPTDLYILEDPAGAELLYHLQQPTHAAERRRILALAPLQQLQELVRLGDRLTAAAPSARSTNAPPPPPTLSTRATPVDAVERALADGTDDDATGAYIRAQNARDLARMKR